jgi:hypothetical protein
MTTVLCLLNLSGKHSRLFWGSDEPFRDLSITHKNWEMAKSPHDSGCEEKRALVKIRLGLCTFLVMSFLLGAPFFSWAWEFGIDSAVLNFRFVYASQAGQRGFFGPFNMDMSSKGGDLASFNGWFRRRGLSGTTAVASSTRLVLFPFLKFNKAVFLTGTYRIEPEDSQTTETALNQGVETLFSRGTWTRLWMTVNCPLGKIYYGKRGFQQGCGLQFSNTQIAEDILDVAMRTVEIFQLETYHGPFTIGVGLYPWRRGSFLYWNFEDQNAARAIHVLSYLNYASGDIAAGVGGFYWTFDEGPEGQLSTQQRASTPPSTTSGTEGWIYVKYANGRLFFNAEADWYYKTIRYQSSRDGTFNGEPAIPHTGGGSRFAPKYIESWRYMLEVGAFSGPFKFSFLWSHMPGPDRRHGILIDKQPFIQEPEKSAYGVFYPYGILMAKYYRSGVDSYSDMSAADVYSAQLQYMVASNLDISSSIMFARRASCGYGYGYIRPTPNKSGNVNFDHRGSFSHPVPSIPDNDLGWELNLGIAWKLLENWGLSLRGAYWQPGKWFNSACIDKSVSNWDHPSSLNNWGVKADRIIEPILGIELYLNAKF